MTNCFCQCHNSFARKNGTAPEHDEEQCPCHQQHDTTARAHVEIKQAVDEQMMQKARMEDALRLIIVRANGDAPIVELVQIAEKALAPTVLCNACHTLTESSPCVRCGSALV